MKINNYYGATTLVSTSALLSMSKSKKEKVQMKSKNFFFLQIEKIGREWKRFKKGKKTLSSISHIGKVGIKKKMLKESLKTLFLYLR